MKVSIIIPVYNDAARLKRCLTACERAITAKTANQTEFIIVDDGSDDKSYQVAKDFARRDITHFRAFTIPHGGVSAARNFGIIKAMGDWIGFIDADDEPTWDAIRIWEDTIAKTAWGNIIQFNHLRYYEPLDKTALKYTNDYGVHDPLKERVECWCMVWNKLYRRSFLKFNMIRFEKGLQYGEDELFNLECFRFDHDILCQPERVTPLLRHFDNKHSLSRSKNEESCWKQDEALREFLKSIKSNNKLRRFVVHLIGEHWISPTFVNNIGGEEEL